MSKVKVDLFMDDDRQLYVRGKDGTEFRLDVFEGGGYYTALWPRTETEITDSIKQREEFEAKHLAEIKAKDDERNVKGLARLIMFMQGRRHG